MLGHHRQHDDFEALAASRHPFETYLLALAFVSGVPLLFGEVTSQSIERALPSPLVAAWGAILMLGSAIALVGMYWRGALLTGFVMERAGLVGVGGAALIYSASLVVEAGIGGTYAACITVGFGVACFAQARRISRRLARLMEGARHDVC